ncbi:MAG TPA: DUF6230 family protein [Sporichthyaceae bacterium]|jgi:hypothetical protein
MGEHRRSARLVATLHAKHRAMLTAAEQGPEYGTRWARGAAVFAPAAVASAAVGVAMAQGALAAGFNVTNQKFGLHIDELDGSGLGAVLVVAQTQSGSKPVVLHAALSSAKLSGLCILVHQSLLGVNYTISIGSVGTQQSSGTNLLFDITDLSSTSSTLTAVLGVSADTVRSGDQSLGGVPGAFGLTNGEVTLHNVYASAYQTQVVGGLTLPNLGIHVHPGDVSGC